jgi:AraC family transcriptional regulator
MANVDHTYRINEVLSVIHRDIAADLQANTLAKMASFSEQHFHRLFKKITGEAVHQYVRRTRLEIAANQLLFSPQRSIQSVAESCGFLSLSSFTRAFKSIYSVTPGQWREQQVVAHTSHAPYFLADPEINAAYQRVQSQPLPTPSIVMLAPCDVAYVRHKGYGRSISASWELLRAWALSENRAMDYQIGLHHSNPALMPLHDCHYVACMRINKPVVRRGIVNSVTIPGGLHAAFSLQGQYGELLPYMIKMYEEWLPASTFTTKTTPAFAHYKKNQFLSEDDHFELVFYLPIALKHSA